MVAKKRQHYIPRFYLKLFSIDDNEKSTGIYNIKSGRFISNGPLKSQAYKDYFYGKDMVIENNLSTIEGFASEIIRKILNEETLPQPYSDNHITLLTFIVFLYSRTIHAEEDLNEATDKFIKTVFSNDPEVNDSLKHLKIKNRDSIRLSLSLSAKVIPITFDLDYKILKNNTQMAFITSDHPVVLYNQFMETRKLHGSNTGFASKGLQIFFPLSPHYLLLCYDREVYKVGNKKEHTVIINDEKDVFQLNTLQYLNAYENIFFNHAISKLDIINLEHIASRYRLEVNANVNEYQGPRETNGTSHSLIHMFKEDIQCNLFISKIIVLKKAKKYKFGNKAVHVRNEGLCRMVEAMND